MLLMMDAAVDKRPIHYSGQAIYSKSVRKVAWLARLTVNVSATTMSD